MAKRTATEAFDASEVEVTHKKDGKKHSLDSDEEDSGAEEEKNNVLNADDIEGEEEGIAGVEGEVSTINLINFYSSLQKSQYMGILLCYCFIYIAYLFADHHYTFQYERRT